MFVNTHRSALNLKHIYPWYCLMTGTRFDIATCVAADLLSREADLRALTHPTLIRELYEHQMGKRVQGRTIQPASPITINAVSQRYMGWVAHRDSNEYVSLAGKGGLIIDPISYDTTSSVRENRGGDTNENNEEDSTFNMGTDSVSEELETQPPKEVKFRPEYEKILSEKVQTKERRMKRIVEIIQEEEEPTRANEPATGEEVADSEETRLEIPQLQQEKPIEIPDDAETNIVNQLAEGMKSGEKDHQMAGQHITGTSTASQQGQPPEEVAVPEDLTAGEVIPPRGPLDVVVPVRPRSGILKRTQTGTSEDQPAHKKARTTPIQTQAPLSSSIRTTVQESGNAILTVAQMMQGIVEGLAKQPQVEPARVAEVDRELAKPQGRAHTSEG